ncbi:TPA: alpha/beta hydrolase [Candidatus Woesearchaeota archaeon]|nr:MAG: hypothetical protein QT04_C0004G0016 [archaeon GW2011_AR11]MBS3110496.1 alpha/beta hydrolase [Candidatus Woesearchaeota archaeon]HAM40337.1 alpha/beta hydrolase [Candidatus Omnitrophota bacterium]HIH92239.1 alpha/beta hydrolase [Candidatus Woesearchaeota archaeon]HIJ18981.1 alpha/beta hydrolase [Candidatus Woesearchaeota archaeon]
MPAVQVILIHGNDTLRWSYAWMPWVKSELEKLGLEVIGETFPDSILAREKYWIPFLKDRLHAGENSILIGHSSGATAAMRFAEGNRILGSILVSPSYSDQGIELERQSGYFGRPWQWGRIRANQRWIVQFGSTDDPFMPVEQFRHIHGKLGTEYREFTDRNHFFYGQDTFPEIISTVKEKLNL